MIENHYDKTARIDRLVTTTGNKKSFSTHIASLACHIQPLDPQITGDIEGGFGKNCLMFSANADIREGDRVFIDSKEYRIVSSESLSFKSSHQETIIRIFE